MKAFLKIVTIIIILFYTVIIEAQWGTPVSIPFPQGHAALAFYAVDANVVWCNSTNTSGGISNWFARTTDGGAVWKANTISGEGNLDNGSITALDSITAWVTKRDLGRTTGGAIFKTTNGGITWIRQFNVFNETGANPMFIHFWNADTGLVVGENVTSWKIYTTTNGGMTWTPVPQSNIPPISGDLLTEGFEYDVVDNSFWFCTSSRVFRSRDRGQTWTAAAIGQGYGRVHSVAFQNQKIGLATSFAGNNPTTVKTTDGGDTWFPIAPPSRPTPHILEHVPGTAGVYIVTGHIWPGTLTGSAYTLDAGSHWTTIDNLDHGASVFVGPNIGWIGGYPNSLSNCSKWTGSVLVTSVPLGGIQLWLKSDTGIILNGPTVSNWTDQSGNGNDAIQSNTDRQPLFVNNELNGKPVLRFDGDDDRLGLKGTDSTSQITLFLIEKLDSGKRGYSPFYIPIILGNSYGPGKQYGVAMRDISSENSSNTIFPFSSGNSLYATVTNCSAYNQWKVINITSNHYLENTSLRINGIDAVISDNGNLSIPLSFSLGDSTGTGLGCIGGGGTSSFPESEPIRFKGEIAEVILYNRVLSESERLTVENYLADKYGISNPTGVEDFQENKISERFALNQNYPNPFNPSTTISFSIPNSEFIALKVFDVLGREVTTLVNEEKPAGNYEVNFIASQLSSGIYFYKIQAGSFVETKKMILLK